MKKFKDLFKKLYFRKEALPDLCSIAFVLTALMVVPLYYSKIQNHLTRVILALLIFLAAIVTVVVSAIRYAKRNKCSEHFDWLRLLLVVLAILILQYIVVLNTSKFGISSSFGRDTNYPLKEIKGEWKVPIINSLSFAVFSQLILTAISAGYVKTKSFFLKLAKALIFVAIPLFLLMLLSTYLGSKVFAVGFILTIVLWFTAVSANEILDYDWQLRKEHAN
ncbi:MAG: hypothetical protein K5769_04565 [Pseudobutyrivibrio sp.]|nr:hypothetical protein [Pseudobutyrivibrio sp.]